MMEIDCIDDDDDEVVMILSSKRDANVPIVMQWNK